MKKNSTLILKLSTLIVAILTSNSSYSAISRYTDEIGTPEIDRRIQEAQHACQQFGGDIQSPGNDVYWSVSPRTDRAIERAFKLEYLAEAEAEAERARRRHSQQQEEIRQYQAELQYQREIQRKIQIEWSNIQRMEREERQRQNALRPTQQYQYYRRPVQSPESPGDIVTWGESSPIHSIHNAGLFSISECVQKTTLLPTTIEDIKTDVTSDEASSSRSSLVDIFEEEHKTSDKENQKQNSQMQCSPTQLTSQAIQKRPRDKITSQGSTRLFSDDMRSPLRKVKKDLLGS
jgi:hypothetical protein